MIKTVKVTYNSDTLETAITVDGNAFDTSRINGREIEDWAYPFMMRKVKWNGFYDEMVEALGGAEVFLQPVGCVGGDAVEKVADGLGQSGPQGSEQGVHGIQSKG